MTGTRLRDGHPVLLSVRPRKIAILCAIFASLALAAMIVVGVLLRGSADGVAFEVSDQVGLIGLGVLLAGGILLGARPRVQATETGLWVRGMMSEAFVPWPVIERVAFPPGANWAQLQLADDEVRAVMAVQTMDRDRAVRDLRALRELHVRYGTPRNTAPSPEYLAELLRAEQARPLGRLEIIDRARAAHGPRTGRRR